MRRLHAAEYLAPGAHGHVARRDLGGAQPPLHDHDFPEVFAVLSGTCRHRVNGAVQTIPWGAAVFVRAADRHALSGDPACRVANLMFRPETLDHVHARYGGEIGARGHWHGGPLPVVLRPAPAAFARLADRLEALGRGSLGLARTEGALLQLLALLIVHEEEDGPDWFARALRDLRRPEIFRRGAAGLVSASGRGHAHVCRTARAVPGRSPTELANGARIDWAAARLAETDDAVAEIARACGFEAEAHFYRLFAAAKGTTPARYRQEARRRAPL